MNSDVCKIISRPPTRCPDHPNAEILHTWEIDILKPGWAPIKTRERFECSVCGKQLYPMNK